MKVDDVRLNKLIQVIETYRRRLISNIENIDEVEYIATGNEMEKVKAPCCHIIEARRGCGKTTFISKALFDEDDVLQIYVDCQKYNNTDSDTIILEICKTILEKILVFFDEDSLKKYEKQYISYTKGFIGFIRKKLKTDKNNIVKNYNSYFSLKKLIYKLQESVDDIITKPKEQVFNYKDSSDNSHSNIRKFNKIFHKENSVDINIEGNAELKHLSANIQTINNYKKVTENVYEITSKCSKSSKVDSNYSRTIRKSELIDQLKVCFAALFTLLTKEYGQRTVLLLDDFYQIEMNSQPRILQYFHGIYKESGSTFCFKAVAIPDSIKINDDGQKLFSKKDDFPTILLNYDLNDIDKLVSKLIKILISIDREIGISDSDIRSLFTNGTLVYLAMASGGIPRDFMALFSDTLIYARDKGDMQVTKADLYAQISELKKEKDGDREVDLIGFSDEAINLAIDELEKWVDTHMVNVMLYPLDLYKKHEKLLKALINLRYIHIINEHVTPEGKSIDTVGILLDMTLYATSGRLPNNFKICEFWIKDRHSNQLRKAPIGYFKNEFVEGLESSSK